MSRRLSLVLAGATLALVVPLCVAAGALGLGRGEISGVAPFSAQAGFVIGQVMFAFVGAIILVRRPGHRMGLTFSALGIVASLSSFAQQYVLYGFQRATGSLPLIDEVAWLGAVIQFLPIVMFSLMLLLFPTGHLLSSRWTWVVVFLAASVAALGVISVLVWPLRGPEMITTEDIPGSQVADVLGQSMLAIVATATVASVVAVIVRYRRAPWTERLQIKWFLFGGLLGVAGLVMGGLVAPALGNDALATGGILVEQVGVIAMPVGAGIAILRHGLYDIDRIINRTIVYGAVTALLATAYFGVVLLFQSVLPVSDDSPVAVAASTLAVVVLFRPLSGRVQVFVDRRFSRQRYDRARTIEGFGARLRSQTDLEELSSDLLTVVRGTMQPAHASLWLRQPDKSTR